MVLMMVAKKVDRKVDYLVVEELAEKLVEMRDNVEVSPRDV